MNRLNLIGFAALALCFALTPVSAQNGAEACPQFQPTPHDAEHDALLNYAARKVGAVCAVKSGPWSDPATWNRVPAAGDSVFIPERLIVTYDLQSSPAYDVVLAAGDLHWSHGVMNVDTLITTGAFTTQQDVKGGVTIADNGPLDPVKDTQLLTRGVIGMGPVDIRGEKKTPFVRLAAGPAKGSTVLQAAVPQDWSVGDEIVIAGVMTRCPAVGSVQICQYEDEKRKIAAIAPGLITIDAPLVRDHIGPLNPHVANLTRSFVIQNANPAVPITQRGHVMFMANGIHVGGVETRLMGRTDKSKPTLPASSFSPLLPTSNVKGRYAMHFHKAGLGRVSTLQGSSIHGNAGWGVASHDSWVNMIDNVTHDSFGAGFVAENGSEAGTWDRNIAIRNIGNRPCLTKNFVNDDHWRCGTGFAMSRHVVARDNVCTGAGNGECFGWMTRREKFVPIAATDIPVPEIAYAAPTIDPDKPQLFDFSRNEAYASVRGLIVTKSGPQQRHAVRSYITDFTAWNVEDGGIDLTYTDRYTLIRPKVINTWDPNGCAIELAKNTMDVVVIDADVTTAPVGICDRAGVTAQLTAWPDRMFIAINPKCAGCGKPLVGAIKQLSGTFGPQVTLKDNKLHKATQYSPIASKTITDALGTYKLSEGTWDVIKYYGADLKALMLRDGYCFYNGVKAVKVREAFTSRVDPTIHYRDWIIDVTNSYFNVPAKNNGLC